MSLDGLENRADVTRLVDDHLQKPGVLPAPAPSVSLLKSGAPSDEDFPNPPGDGTLAFDREAGTLYIRDEGEWGAI